MLGSASGGSSVIVANSVALPHFDGRSNTTDRTPPATPRISTPHTQWRRRSCANCNEGTWASQDGPSSGAAVLCAACSTNPDRAKQCGICFEACVPCKLQCHDTAANCQGTYCTGCMSTICRATLESGSLTITCPHPACRAPITINELKQIAPVSYRHFLSLRHEQQEASMLSAFERNPELLEWAIAGNAQICPHCSVLVERSAGCLHMTCTCGKEFCYICGGVYPCTNKCASGRWPCGSSGRPTLRREVVQLMRGRLHARLAAFLLGTHGRCGAESAVRLLPPDVVQRIVTMAADVLSHAHARQLAVPLRHNHQPD